MGVSPSTVVEAYDRLAAEGVIRARPRLGLLCRPAALPPLALAEIGPRLDRRRSVLGLAPVARCRRRDAEARLRLAAGRLDAEAALRRALRALARADDARALPTTAAPRGSPALRQLCSRRFADEGIEASPDQILLTRSGTQAIDLICRFLLEPGDTVLVDDPCYFNFQALLRAHRAKIVGVPYTPSGPDIAAFAQALAEHRPRLYITNSALHNPTGATLSPQTAHRLLKLRPPTISPSSRTISSPISSLSRRRASPRSTGSTGSIRIGSFSKTLSASIRCGYIAARADWIEGLVDLQVATTFGGPSPVAAELVLGALSDGSYRKHMEGCAGALEARRETGAKLEALGIRPWLMPRGGFYLWCRLPDGHDAADVARARPERERRAGPRQRLQPVANGHRTSCASTWRRCDRACVRRAGAGAPCIMRSAPGQAAKRDFFGDPELRPWSCRSLFSIIRAGRHPIREASRRKAR